MTPALDSFEVTRGGRDDPAALPRLDAALAHVGACYVRDPALAPALLDGFAAATADFFRRPPDGKAPLAAGAPGTPGYRAPGSGAYGAADGTAVASRDRCELFKVGREGPGGEPEGWAQAAPAMRTAWRALYDELERTSHAVAGLLAAAAGPADPGLAGWMADHASNLAVNWYPGSGPGGSGVPGGAGGRGGAAVPEGGLRGAHTDFGPFTLLHHPGGADGLDVEVDGTWVAVPPRPDHLLLLLGDMLPFATGGRWRAPRHRVSTPSSAGERMSVVFFVFPGPDTVVAPPGTAAATQAVTAGRFVAERLDRVYA